MTPAAIRQMRADTSAVLDLAEEILVDKYGNPISGNRVIFCCFPDCGCDGARLCMAENGANRSACNINVERGSVKVPQ